MDGDGRGLALVDSCESGHDGGREGVRTESAETHTVRDSRNPEGNLFQTRTRQHVCSAASDGETRSPHAMAPEPQWRGS
jgi:hypothetical protein